AVSCEATATIGCENVTVNIGAKETSPTGVNRVTSSGALVATGLRGASVAGGANAASMVFPVRGGGCVLSRSLKPATSLGSDFSGGKRANSFLVSLSDKDVAVAAGAAGEASATGAASLKRKRKPGSLVTDWSCCVDGCAPALGITVKSIIQTRRSESAGLRI